MVSILHCDAYGRLSFCARLSIVMAFEVDLTSGLSELAKQVRSVTVHSLRTARPEMLTWTPPGLSNHILWHAGHAVWVGDVLTVEPITGRSERPAGWEVLFGDESKPGVQTKWPNSAEVSALLEMQLDRILTLFAERSSTIIQRAIEMQPNSGWPLLTGIIHGWHDEAKHQGEMHLLGKLYRCSL